MHRSVLLKEVLERLDPKSGETIVDGTLGFGGHAEAILERLGPKGRLIGFDQDPLALEAAQKRLERYGDRVMFFGDNFRNVGKRLAEKGIGSVDGFLLDLGVSSMQLDRAERGFSFQGGGPLDMRMNPGQKLTASDVVNTSSEEALRDLLWKYGEERFARQIARRIVAERQKRKIQTTTDLAAIVSSAVPAAYRHGRIHPATRTFQALRIVVNDELGALEAFLSPALDLLGENGRLVVISFHSLEDRIVKWAFREFEKMQKGVILTKKPVEATDEEARENPRSRSAKLRAFERRMNPAPRDRNFGRRMRGAG